MSAKKEDLFLLIQSLSKAEKRHFKLEANRGKEAGNSKYLQLFEAIQKMDYYDEEKLKKKPFVKNLSVEKSYLSETILRSLRKFHSEKSVTVKIRDFILDARILHNRELFEQAQLKLEKARRMAYDIHDFTALLEINKAQTFYLLQKRKKGHAPILKKLNEERHTLKEILDEEIRFLSLNYQLSSFFHKSQSNHDEIVEEQVLTLLRAKLNNEPSDIQSFHARIRFLQCKALSNRILGKATEAYQFNQQIIEEYDLHPKIRKEFGLRYILSLYNFIQKNLRNERYNEVPALLKKFKEISTTINSNANTLFILEVQINLLYYLNTDQFDKAGELATIVEKGLSAFQVSIQKQIMFHHNIAILFFINEQFVESKDWLERTMKIKKAKARLDLQRIARIFDLIIEIENTKKEEAVESALRSCLRYLKVHAQLPPNSYERQLHSLLRQLYYAAAKDKKQIYKTIYDYLQSKKTSPKAHWPGLEEISYWIESKISGITMIQLIKKSKVF